MNLIALDLEATCDEPLFDRNQMEIIEIGACLVNAELKVVSQFQTFVRPIVHPQLSAFCTQLTSIKQADVESAPGFVVSILNFEAWIAQCAEEFGPIEAWGSWGDYDRKQFERNARLVSAPMPAFLTMEHINFKARYAKELGLKGKGAGLGKALNYENLRFDGTAHRGIDDALNIARLLPVALGHRESVWRDRPAKPTR
ncbi:3'-5' exonuclease (plasmid) [Pseudomonas silesiensis]|uniref:3'-5' exonuclease n=1 Tax=Pseudomonas silesiensis TaxID=1853130 RepID=UPI0030CDF562